MSIRVITLWRAHVPSSTTSVSTIRFVIELVINLYRRKSEYLSIPEKIMEARSQIDRWEVFLLLKQKTCILEGNMYFTHVHEEVFYFVYIDLYHLTSSGKKWKLLQRHTTTGYFKKAIKFNFKGSYEKQNLTQVVISYDIYETHRSLVS